MTMQALETVKGTVDMWVLMTPMVIAITACDGNRAPHTCAPPETGDDANAGSAGEVDVPIMVMANKEFTIPIQVGGVPLDVLLDTGSPGLFILPNALPDCAFTTVSAIPITVGFGGGLVLDGVVAQAVVTMGSLSTPNPIDVMLVQSCNPNCDVNGPYKAILGAGFATAGNGVGDPIGQLSGHPAFVIDVPSYASTSGWLRIAPSADTIAPFQLFSLPPLGGSLSDGTPTFDNHGLPECVSGYPAGTSYCEAGELDTGQVDTVVFWAAYTSATPTVFPPGTAVTVSIGPDGGVANYTFTVGATPTPSLDEVEIATPTAMPHINPGVSLFFYERAYFDPLHGVVGLAPH